MKAGPSLAAVAATYLRLVNLTFGGGDPTMAALHRELVVRRGWMGHAQYGLIYGLARVTPGTNLLAFCAGTAWFIRGWPAAAAAVAAATIPSTLVILWLTWAYQRLHENALARGVVAGTLAAAVGMMVAAAFQLVRPGLKRGRAMRTALLFGAASALLLLKWLGPLQVLALAALAGLAWPERK